MITGTTIHNWLQRPSSVQKEKLAALHSLHADFPFFTPAALLLHFNAGGNDRNLSLEELHGYNPVVFYYWNKEEEWVSEQKTFNKVSFKAWNASEEDVLLEHEKEHTEADYFKTQGINVPDDMPNVNVSIQDETTEQSLMVVMSFAEWLHFLQRKTRKEQEEEDEKRALKAQWQKQKMAEAIEEENEEIPATVFEMAVNSIAREDGIISESMAVVYVKQGKISEAINIYKKLSLNNPEKSIYFANKIENLQKEI